MGKTTRLRSQFDAGGATNTKSENLSKPGATFPDQNKRRVSPFSPKFYEREGRVGMRKNNGIPGDLM